jgi:hypothetical protein
MEQIKLIYKFFKIYTSVSSLVLQHNGESGI